ncbi:MAG: bifunctional 5,10-methylenetetrahydrofolate dehydrogenase/5,10-methenyltetrahydrofolate cyclohydrolase [Elusimicrobium sp.]|uniref:Bifunctional protein FolD n=1 Tax=Candidatus Avelusimicrobium gallicola TaxID=2562704 RepID=A0A928DPA9_9BACT|nr:bifunctional 5,10-methylenetetrahydrofolate dehydrogenase/5,10-methenyltetrahydrofolate cyclohydrolase [Elusimicrobium sp.]
MILEGKTLAAKIRQTLPQRAERVRAALGRPIKLCAIGSTEDYGAHVYLKKEVEAAQKLGVETQIYEVNNQTPAKDFLKLVETLSADDTVDAILIPRPLPAHLAATNYADKLAPQKDIDGMSTINMGNLFLCKTWKEVQALPGFVSCTAMAVVLLLAYHCVKLEGAEAVVIGRSITVGRPLAHLLTCQNATVKICHTKTDLPRAVRDADVVCSAAGKPGLLDASWLKKGAIVADISTNWDEQNNRLCGDAVPEQMDKFSVSYSPVPGGVGPVTLAVLLENIIISGERKI